MIIVEGPDNAGKSTLVKHLCETFNLTEGKRGTANRDDLWKVTVSDTNHAIHEALHGQRKLPQIWDRLFFSEFVYSKYAGRTCEFSDHRKQLILDTFEEYKFPIILCMPQKHVVLEKNDRHQMEGVNENLGHIYDDYLAMIDWMPKHTYIYNYKVEKPEDRLHSILGFYLRERIRRANQDR